MLEKINKFLQSQSVKCFEVFTLLGVVQCWTTWCVMIPLWAALRTLEEQTHCVSTLCDEQFRHLLLWMIANLSFFIQSYYLQKSSLLAQTEGSPPISHDFLAVFMLIILSSSFHLLKYLVMTTEYQIQICSFPKHQTFTSNLIYTAFYTFQDTHRYISSHAHSVPGLSRKNRYYRHWIFKNT